MALQVTIREQATGELVRQFSTNSARFADEQVAMWVKRYAKYQLGELSVQRDGTAGE